MSNEKNINVDNHSKNYGSRATLAQILATLAQSFLIIELGMELSMPTIVIKDLYDNPNSEFSLTLDEISWYGSILFIFHPIGSLLSGFLQETLGRKLCMIIANIPSFFGWIVLYYASSKSLLYTSTVLMGLSIGFSEAPILTYTGEITEPRLRGSMLSLASTGAMVGSSLIYILGFLFEWRTVALLCGSCPIICISLVLLIPESPIWLISKGKNEKAEEALCWLRGWVDSEKIKTEYLELIHYNNISGNNNISNNCKLFKKLAEFKEPSVYRPLRLVMIIFFITQIISFLPARPFISKIFEEVGVLDNQSFILVILAVLQNIGCITVILIIRRLGKRILALLTITINTILMLLFGLYVVALKNGHISSTPCIPTTIICGIYFFGACFCNLPWMLLSEIFPNKSRGIATGSCAALSNVLMFIITKLYLSVEIFITLEYTLIVFGSVGVFGLVYLYYNLPETENKSLLVIEECFS